MSRSCRDTSSLNLNVIKERMTESEFQKGDDVIRVANKEYPSNSILDIRVERC